MKNTWRWLIIVAVTTIAACSQKKNGSLEVTGTIKNIDKATAQYQNAINNGNITLVLYEVPFGTDLQPVQLDSVTVSAQKNTFHLKGAGAGTGMYNIAINNGPMIPIVADASDVTIDIDFAQPQFYQVKGSDASKQLGDFIFNYGSRYSGIERAMNQLDSLKKFGAADSLLMAGTDRKNAAITDLNNYLKSFMANVNHPVVASFAVGRSGSTLPTAEFEAELGKLVKKFPTDPNLTDLKARYEAYKQQAAKSNSGSWTGKKAPDFSMPDVNGQEVSLSSFKGKYVLVDFWASWCVPCRNENPNVVAAYNKYKNKNFTVLGVSLDKDKGKWIEAIQQDQLNWTQISDLAYWNSKAVTLFGFNGIPFNVLVDPQGTVVGEALRGEALEEKLQEVLK
jgi:peroxiredoxin